MTTLNGRQVPDELHRDALAIKRKGGKVFLVTPDIGAGELNVAARRDKSINTCPNCGGWGHLGLQFVVGGPADVPLPANAKEDESTSFVDGKWYLLKTKVYPCPVCLGQARGIREALAGVRPAAKQGPPSLPAGRSNL